MKLFDIASALNATLDNADGNTEITGVAGIEEATAGQITFVANPKYAAIAKTTPAHFKEQLEYLVKDEPPPLEFEF